MLSSLGLNLLLVLGYIVFPPLGRYARSYRLKRISFDNRKRFGRQRRRELYSCSSSALS